MTTFAASQRFGAVVLSFSLASMYFLISFLISWLAHSFFSRMFFSLQIFFTFSKFLVVDFEFHSIVAWKYAWHDLDFFVLVERWFVSQYGSILENVPCALKKNVNSAVLGWNVLNISVKSIWSSVSFKAVDFLLRYSVNCCNWGVEVPYYYGIIINEFLYVCD